MQDILEGMIEDFDTRWGDGTNINRYTLGTNDTNKGQPCGYTKGQVLWVSDNLTLVVFMHEELHLLRKIRTDRIVLEVLGTL
jgi:hypothetical protein